MRDSAGVTLGDPGALRAAGLSDLSQCVSAAQWFERFL
jgi:hypothetical protein